MKISIGANIRQLRKAREISQEQLAEAVGVTVQAVSKWETQQSLPDIGIVPEIAEFFGVTLDELFFGGIDISAKADVRAVPSNGKLYIVQVRDGKILGSEEWERDKRIYLDLGERDNQLSAEIWGNADIKGNVGGKVVAEGSVNCGNVAGGVVADGSLNCGNVAGAVVADGMVNCGNVVGDITTDAGVNCGNIAGAVSSQGDVHCGDISQCKEIRCQRLYAEGKITCEKIEGEVYTGEDINIDF